MTVLGPRRLDPERMDERWSDRRALAGTLRRLSVVNDRLGGTRALRRTLRRELGPLAGLRFLDVGTGDAALPARLLEWAREGNTTCRVVGLDLHPQIALVAREGHGAKPEVEVVRGDGRRLPFPDRSFDVSVSTLTLHHMDDEGALRAVSEMARVSRRLVVVNDLERCFPNLLGARLLAATLWRTDPVMAHDGPLSVLRSFTPEELRRIGEAARLRDVRVDRSFPYRLVLTGRPAA